MAKNKIKHGQRDLTNVFRLLLVMTVLLFGLSSCGEKKNAGPEKGEPLSKAKEVKINRVRARPSMENIEYAGTLSAVLKVNVATELGGIIEKLFFEKGDRVKAGQILAEIGASSIRLEVRQARAALAVVKSNYRKIKKGSRPEEISIAGAALKQARAAFIEAENNFQRVENLYNDQAVSNSQYDSAKRAVETARANVNSAGQKLELTKQGPRLEDREASEAGLEQARAALAMAKDRLRKSRLSSPSEGIIAFRQVEEGEIVRPGTVITRVVDKRRMKIELSIGERYIPVLEKKRQFSFTVDAIPGKVFTCRLSFLSPTADLATRSFPIELAVDEPAYEMADGMTTRVKFPLINPVKTIKVPSAWLAEENGQMGLFMIKNGKAFFVKVVLGSYYEQQVEILSGISDQDQVITNPAGLKNGDKVTLKTL